MLSCETLRISRVVFRKGTPRDCNTPRRMAGRRMASSLRCHVACAGDRANVLRSNDGYGSGIARHPSASYEEGVMS
jgi:hypothetical protein